MVAVKRNYWIDLINTHWKERSLIWLKGVRRSGKTYLVKSLDKIEYFDCELPSVRQQLEDPEQFLKKLEGKRIVLDEIHRIKNPSELLKIASDYFPSTKIIATGSSTLGASSKFKDTLAGRKREIWLTPMILTDLDDFHNKTIEHRMLFGGLPPFFLCSKIPESDFQEWVDSYWAKDIQELYRLERRFSFQRFFELLLINSGGIFEATKYSAPCEISRTTVTNYLSVLEDTSLAHVIRPFSSHKPSEIVTAPKVYGFDTGFICYYRGIGSLRPDDFGFLWEHYVLNELHAKLQRKDIYYWRDKMGHEVDIVLTSRNRPPIAIECKWSYKNFEIDGIRAFRKRYIDGENWVVSHNIDKPFVQNISGICIEFMPLDILIHQKV